MADREESNKHKDQGNDFFSRNLYNPAVECYTKAIDTSPQDNKHLAILYGNRAFANLKMENFGLAIMDSDKALELDPEYLKAYYRRGSANLGLGKHAEALKDFKEVVVKRPSDKDAKLKFQQCQKAIQRARFEAAIAREHDHSSAADNLDLSTIVVGDDYKGPRLGDDGKVTLEFCTELAEHFKSQKNLHKKYLYQILIQVKALFDKQPNVISIPVVGDGRITVCGDVHGQYYDLLNIFVLNGMPSETNAYLFNGDFVDRGSFSCEVVILFLAYKLAIPNHFFMSRGNHESRAMTKVYGFEGEVKAKYDSLSYDLFTEVFDFLPLGHIIGEKIFVVHGGLFGEDGVTLDHIQKVDRKREPPNTGIMADMLWADPQAANGRAPSKRGVGQSFGPNVTNAFLQQNKLDMIIRSHEVKEQGYLLEHGGKLVTLFSAPNYCDQVGNMGAYGVIKADLIPKFDSFKCVPHPSVPPMAYASPSFGF